ncbi:hypothetical protein CAter10_4783 [Collimonas arenae]|nr:hypothetical protein CAter10_4783 [Collimonas arenae]
MPFVRVAHRNPIASKGPQFFDQPVVQLFLPLSIKERLRFVAIVREFRAVAPPGVE